jgi:nucleoid-associated protein YgaU
MTILHKLIIIAVCTFAFLSGCCLLPPSDQPLPAGESLPRTEIAVPATLPEIAPPAPTSPVTTPTTKTVATPPEERSSKPRLSYTVSEGELLWSIAKRADVYGDPLLWPLLYQANRDQIKDPRKIYAGQTLTIPRNISDEEREKARNLAKKSAIFSPE